MAGMATIKVSNGSGQRPRQIPNSTRGVEANALTTIKVNNEVAFCKVYNLKQKEEVEKLLLKNRISYYIKWREKSFLKRMFDTESKEKTIFIICIHDTAVDQARALLADMPDIKLLV